MNNGSNLAKSWVKLLTNEAFIRNLKPETLANILVGQKFPKEIFFSLIHEATHHWCFTSLIGNVLFFIKQRTYLISKEEHEKSTRNDVLLNLYIDNSKYKGIIKILSPIIEGLALFAEYDSHPSKTEATPDYLTYLAMAYSGLSEFNFKTSISDIEDKYSNFLFQVRHIEGEAIRRKAELLVEPISLESSPYLIGYLFIKSLQHQLIYINDKFRDPNLFLHFARAYYFNDFGLINLIFDSTIRSEEIVQRIASHLFQRNKAILDLDSDFINKFELNLVNQTDPKLLNKILTSKDVVDSSMLKMEKARQEIIINLKIESQFYMRSFFKITQLPCYVKINKNRVSIEARLPIEQEEHPIIKKLINNGAAKVRNNNIDIFAASFPNNEKFSDFEGECLFHKYLTFTNSIKSFFVLISKNNLKYCHFNTGGKWNSSEIKYITTFFSDLSTVPTPSEMDSKIEELLKTKLYSFTEMNEINNIYFKQFQDYFESISLQCEKEQLNGIKELMFENGFWEILDGKQDLIQLLSKISLICSNGRVRYTEFESFLGDFHQLKELNKKLIDKGFDIFHFDGEYIDIVGI